MKTLSQAGQDLFAITMLDKKRNGKFLEFGCYDPIFISNTWNLEKEYGFTGISIDICDLSIDYNKGQWMWENFYSGSKDPSWPEHVQSFEDLSEKQQNDLRTYCNYDIIVGRYADAFKTIDLIPISQRSWNTIRPSTEFYCIDALQFDFEIIENHYDYLSIDIDPAINNLRILEKCLQHSCFSVITFEHDLYTGTDESKYVREQSRKLLKEKGYICIANDVTLQPELDFTQEEKIPVYFEDWWVYPEFVSQKLIDMYTCITDNLRPKYFTEILRMENHYES